MSTNEIDYNAVLADLEQRRDSLETAIRAIRMIVDAGATAGWSVTASRSAAPGKPGELPSDAFFNMPILAAAKKYLSIVKQPTAAPVIARALKAHGLLNDSKGFAGTVYSLLFREERTGGTVVKVGGNKWGLAEWYPRSKRVKGATGDQEASDEPTELEQPV